ncbi:hypothetical protein W97_09043 [Coniosporium apollinis CBS 100218]|uniref:LYR motif-containing protein Cup1-like N-terminal domain-containing protein n=1 Tax=Coniosporium apollinis (strain CBS 100218) TaxID=1168221 RepID=R7Z6G0_CONA1|nr:uncharacterized protein W97_09043 [Coniosporium apollinis CBS 100218]EON69780.1 hypothetical protein W97_09043 [Coniosporium apollinis CBS 100218]
MWRPFNYNAIDPALARHLLRALLRECTYLPDAAARAYFRQHVLARFREHHPPSSRRTSAWPPEKHRLAGYSHDLLPHRLRGLLRQARKGLALLRRANEGEMGPLLRVLSYTYGRSGKARHEMMRSLLLPDVPADSNALTALREQDPPDASGSKHRVTDIPPVFEPPKLKDGTIQYTLSNRFSKLKALLESQRHQRFTRDSANRSPVRSLVLKIPQTNVWERPMPRKREKNKVIEWYARLLASVFPPLPEHAWVRLRDLACASTPWEGPVSRRARPASVPDILGVRDLEKLVNVEDVTSGTDYLTLACRREGLDETGPRKGRLLRLVGDDSSRFTALDLWLVNEEAIEQAKEQLLEDSIGIRKLDTKRRTRDKHRPSTLTHRFMRKMWARVFAQCPLMMWDPERARWNIRWGTVPGLFDSVDTASTDADLFAGVNNMGKLEQPLREPQQSAVDP